MPTAQSSSTVSKVDTDDEIDAVDGLSHDQLDELREQLSSNFAPANAQQEADDEATEWHKQWGKGMVMRPVVWPTDLGDELPEILYEQLVVAGETFPVETGLGWDRLHPRVISRLSKPLVLMLISLIIRCEREGRWPVEVALVLIALLPKSDGGFRPIGLLPFLPRVWMRVRKALATKWEQDNDRPYLYAGKRKGANVAAWKQAAAAEAAATAEPPVSYAQALLDLVKAFDRIPHWLLVREAVKLGYPLRLLRLSLATYLLDRVIRIGGVVSHTVVALRGITAGSGFATTEMRVI